MCNVSTALTRESGLYRFVELGRSSQVHFVFPDQHVRTTRWIGKPDSPPPDLTSRRTEVMFSGGFPFAEILTVPPLTMLIVLISSPLICFTTCVIQDGSVIVLDFVPLLRTTFTISVVRYESFGRGGMMM